ncbi:MAG: topoisomerase C-terminal repeat-containing protein [Clostridia bacterium]|nr:topoisomerase C-terminal repeat-containing protein [Clostridia bacterium]
MKLIIAEKPSLARNICQALGSFSKKGNFYINNEYIVTWVFGHLFSLADIEYYNPNPDGRWTMKNIPCFPQKFHFELRRDKNGAVDSGVQAQFETIRSLCLRDDVDTIVNAGDSDREGEIIVRTCIEKTGVKDKTITRLWLPDQTAETVRAAVDDMKNDSEYDNLAFEGYARTYIDWLFGVNLTRYATLKTGNFLRVGRVIVPIVKAIYDRDMAIRNFVPDIYYSISSKTEIDGCPIELTSKSKFDKNELSKAQELCRQYNEHKAVVTSKKRKKDTISPGKLYSLSKLQNVLGKKYKMPMDKSLAIVQDLYEKGYVTYPRTNSEYLATAEQDKVKGIISAISALGYNVKFKTGKTIFDDSKIESHSALTPTHKIPSKTSLSPDEFTVYSTILRRFAAVFCSEDCIADKTEIQINVGGYEDFNLKGTIIVEKGWTKYDDYTKKDKLLPPLEKGDTFDVNFVPTEKETSPPKHYTIETLNNYLKNPFRDEKKNIEDENDEEEYKAVFEGLELGTEATRTGIIDNARKSGYINLKKDVYTILPAGEYMIESLIAMGINMDKYKTSELGVALKKVFRGEITIDDSVKLAVDEINSVFCNRNPDSGYSRNDIGFMGDVVGVCPLCGKNVVRTAFGYGCSGYKEGCKFAFGYKICGATVSASQASNILKNGRSDVITSFYSKRTSKNFSARLKLDGDKIVFDFS